MDQLSAMRAFVRVVQTGSFSAAGRDMHTTQTTISKKVAALENHIGVKLLTRSSRDHALTQAGAEYYETCVNLLGELDEAEARARSDIALPRGVLRITAPVAFGRLLLAPIISEFFSRYPDIQVDLLLSDKHVDLISEGIDVAIRARQLEDSSLIARHLLNNNMLVLGSPGYFKRFGQPITPNDLQQHNCLAYAGMKTVNTWRFYDDDKEITVPVKGNFQSDNGDVLLEVALSGLGLVLLPIWMVKPYLESGQLVQVLANYTGQDIPFNAIYPHSRYTPLKVRCFVDFLKEKLTQCKALTL